MKIKTITETEVEITLPCFRKSKYRVVKILSERDYIAVYINGDSFNVSRFADLPVAEYFRGDYVPATQTEFADALKEASCRLSDLNDSWYFPSPTSVHDMPAPPFPEIEFTIGSDLP